MEALSHGITPVVHHYEKRTPVSFPCLQIGGICTWHMAAQKAFVKRPEFYTLKEDLSSSSSASNCTISPPLSPQVVSVGGKRTREDCCRWTFVFFFFLEIYFHLIYFNRIVCARLHCFGWIECVCMCLHFFKHPFTHVCLI